MNILIIKLGALGDVVMATPLIEAIQKHHPGAVCHLLTTPAFAPLFRSWPDLEVIAQPRRGWRPMMHTIRLVRRLRATRIYDLQGNDRSAVVCALSGATDRVGNHTRYPYTHHPAEPWNGQCHIFERMVTVLGAAGIDTVPGIPRLPLDEEEHTGVDEWIARAGLNSQPYVVVHAGASAARPEKRWPYFAELGQRLSTAGICPVFVGTDAERDENSRLAAAAAGLDASGAFSVNALAEFGRRSRFAVTNDSGPMHVLAAAGIPVVGLFGPSDWRRNHALGQGEHVIACVEICEDFAGRRTGDCLDRISVDRVWQQLGDAGLV